MRVHALIEGKVHGVGFRWSTRGQAQSLGVDGWVRNLADGRVEAAFSGPTSAVVEVVAWCHHGPSGARVKKLVTRPWDGEIKFGFELRADSDRPARESDDPGTDA